MTEEFSGDPEEIWQALLEKVSAMRAEGMTRFQIERKLRDDWGIDEDIVWDAVNLVYSYNAQKRATKVRSRHNLMWGPIYFFGGLGLTAVSYMVGDDSDLVFWGAIISGALMFMAGVYEVWSNFWRS